MTVPKVSQVPFVETGPATDALSSLLLAVSVGRPGISLHQWALESSEPGPSLLQELLELRSQISGLDPVLLCAFQAQLDRGGEDNFPKTSC